MIQNIIAAFQFQFVHANWRILRLLSEMKRQLNELNKVVFVTTDLALKNDDNIL